MGHELIMAVAGIFLGLVTMAGFLVLAWAFVALVEYFDRRK